MATGATRKPRVMIASPRESDLDKRSIEERRFESLAEALGSGGFAVARATPGGIDELRAAARGFAPDLLFSSFFRFEGSPEGKGYVEELASEVGAAWIGSPATVMETALSKPRMKARWRSHGIPTPDWLVARLLPDGSVEGLEELAGARGFPFIVKPAGEGNSRGIDDDSVVRYPSELAEKAETVARAYGEALVERFVSGGAESREFTAAMIGNGIGALVSAIEIVKARPSAVISEEDKELQTTKLLSIGDPALRGKVEALARRVFFSAGARDYARCDILLHEGRLYAIEMNGQPMVPDRWFAACSREAGLDEVQYPIAIVLAAIGASGRMGKTRISLPGESRVILPRELVGRLMG